MNECTRKRGGGEEEEENNFSLSCSFLVQVFRLGGQAGRQVHSCVVVVFSDGANFPTVTSSFRIPLVVVVVVVICSILLLLPIVLVVVVSVIIHLFKVCC